MENLEFKKELLNQFSSMNELSVSAFLDAYKEKTKENLSFIKILNKETLESDTITEQLNKIEKTIFDNALSKVSKKF